MHESSGKGLSPTQKGPAKMLIHVTTHAIERFRERVADLSDQAIVDALSTPVIQLAAALGAECHVRLPTGQRITVKDRTVVTVLPAEQYKRQVRRQGTGRFSSTPRSYRHN
jgi:hypothetical protein